MGIGIHGAEDIFRHSLFEASDSNGTVLLVLKVQLVIDLRRQFILGCIRTQYLIVLNDQANIACFTSARGLYQV